MTWSWSEAMTKLERVRQKYPSLVDFDMISLKAAGEMMILYNNADIYTRKILGIQDYKEDLKWILGDEKEWIRFDRKNKLNKLNNFEDIE